MYLDIIKPWAINQYKENFFQDDDEGWVQGSVLLLVLEEELAGPGDVEAALGPGPTHPLLPLCLADLLRLLQRLLPVTMIITVLNK
jgi:hypothetical protein